MTDYSPSSEGVATPPSDDLSSKKGNLRQPLLLDLYCCQGGASMGYYRAGWDVVGIDKDPQPRYPFPFLQMNALEAMLTLIAGDGLRFGTRWLTLADFDAGHGSPPCQAKTKAQKIQGREHPRLIEPTRFLLDTSGLPYVIENVVPDDPNADPDPLIDPVMLCGSMFGLETYRHRLFESNVPLTVPDHPEHVARTTKMGRAPVDGEFMHIVGNFSGVSRGRSIMDMDWASRDGLREAIPPAYSEYLGRQLLTATQEAAA